MIQIGLVLNQMKFAKLGGKTEEASLILHERDYVKEWNSGFGIR